MNPIDAFQEQVQRSQATIDEEQVIRLREWGTDRIWQLPDQPDEVWIGDSRQCHIQIAARGVAEVHAVVSYRRGAWSLQAVAGTHVLLDGIPCTEFPITSGAELGVGRTTLVAECRRTVALRAYLRRILGWGEGRARAIDHAQRAIRSALLHRSSTVLVGDSDLASVARALHRYMYGENAPFVVSDRRRRNGTAGGAVRSPANVSDVRQAYMLAVGGSLCVRVKRFPIDTRFIESICEPGSNVHLFVLLHDTPHSYFAGLAGPFPICVPPLQFREQELPRIIDEYIDDAVARFEAPRDCMDEDDREWIAQRCASSLYEIEQASRRLVALRISPSLQSAGSRLGMAAVSLTRWMRRRSPLPPDLEYLQTGPVRLSMAEPVGAAAVATEEDAA